MKTRNVDKSKYKNYLIKAEEFFDIMNESFNKQEYNAVVLNAIHCAISSADALTVFYKGLRRKARRCNFFVKYLRHKGYPEQK